MIERSIADSIVTLRLAHGKASALDLELVDAVALALAELAKDDAVRAVILTGSGSIFSAGVDLYRVTGEGRPYVERFLPALSRTMLDVFSFPKPLVVAANGHAIAGGCIFTLCADYRLMAQGNGRIGMPELLVGVPFPAAVVEIVRFAVPSQHLQSLMYTGRTLVPDDALRHGLVDEVVDAGSLDARAGEVARQLASLPPDAFGLAKRQLRDTTIARAKHYAHEQDSDTLDQWSTPETLDRIAAYLVKTVSSRKG